MTRNLLGVAALAAALVLTPFNAVAALASSNARAAAAQDDTPTDAEQKIFNRGRDLFAKRQFEQASTVFSDFLKKYPNSFISDLMLLWLGRSYIELGKLADAEQVGQRLRTIPDTPFADIYESELQNARRAAAANPARTTAAAAAAAAATPTPAPVTNVASATPPSALVRPIATPTPRPAPAEVSSSRRNPNTPTLNIRAEGNESRPRTTRERPSRRSTAPAAARITPTPQPTPARRESPVLVAEARQPVAPARSTVDASSDGGTVSASPAPDTTQSTGGFSLTVKQVPDLQLALRRAALAAQPGQAIQ